jgi:hypothetical protein
MTSTTKSTSLTLVGRVSSIGTAEQEFTITWHGRLGAVRPFRCECRSARSREAFAAIVDGDLIGIIATIAKGTNGDRSLLLIDRLERLGGPRP